MQTRRCGKTGLDLTVIGFGAMRMHGDDVAPWARLVRLAAEAGFNYFETSDLYCGATSELKVGEGLKGFPRDKVYISTKSRLTDYPTADGIRRAVEQSLKKLRTDYLDFYQLWGLRLETFRDIAVKKGGTIEGIRRAMAEGLVRHLGFTSHDSPPNMISLLGTGEFESVTLQYNLLDRENEPVIAEAGRLGIGVVVMGPLHGGILGHHSAVVSELMENRRVPKRNKGVATGSTAEAAFRFVLSNPNVTCAASGMMNSREIEENAHTASTIKPLSAKERSAVDKTLGEFKKTSDALCTGCRYCMPCPEGVGISEVFRLANASRIYGLRDGSRRDYALFDKDWPYDQFKDASHCTECGECREKCPQKINIPEELKKAHDILKQR